MALEKPRPTRCRTCRAPIFWAIAEATGRLMPIDAGPVGAEHGNVILTGRIRKATNTLETFPEAATLGGAGQLALGGPEPADGEFYVSHYATCPQAGQWRDRTKARASR